MKKRKILCGFVLLGMLAACGQAEENEPKTSVESASPVSEAKAVKVCDLLQCMGKYDDVRSSLTAGGKRAPQLGKIPGGENVSYIEVEKRYVPGEDRGKYIISGEGLSGKISFSSTEKQCDAIMGAPRETTDTERLYSLPSGYEVCLTFSQKGKIKKMGVYRESREKAKQAYQAGDFTMMACRIIKYNGDYQREETVAFPDDAIAVARDAFAINQKRYREPVSARDYKQQKEEWKKMTLCVPKDIYLEPDAFRHLGPVEITFEPGRTEIEPEAFRHALSISFWGQNSSIRLPDTVKVIGDWAFEQSPNQNSEIVLNDGLEEIGCGALQDVKSNLPDTVKEIGKYALDGWEPSDGEYSLPENLEKIGDNAIFVDTEMVEKLKEPILIPRHVKKIGKNPITFERLTEKCGVRVAPENKDFKSDKNGWLYSKDGKTLYVAFGMKQKVIVPDTVKKIRCRIQLASEEDDWQEIIFPEEKLKKAYELSH